MDESFGIEVTFEVLREGKNIQPAIYFKNPTDQSCSSSPTQTPSGSNPPPIGRHTTTAWVQPHLMNVGITHITVALDSPDPFETH